MKWHYVQVGLLLLVSFVLGFNIIIPFLDRRSFAEANHSWYNPSWSFCKTITITNPIAGYQMKLNVTYDSDMQADFDDLRFTDGDETTLLDYWLEYKVNSNYAIVWVELLDAGNTICMYYGNNAVSTASNGTNTWNYFLNWDADHTGDFTKVTSADGKCSSRNTELGVAFDLTDGYRFMHYTAVTTRTINSYNVNTYFGLYDSKADHPYNATDDILSVWLIDTDYAPTDQRTRIEIEKGGVTSSAETYAFFPNIDDYYVFDFKNNATASSEDHYLTSSGSSSALTLSTTGNVPTNDMVALGYGSYYVNTPGKNDFWSYDAVNDAIQWGAFSNGRSTLKLKNKWVAIGMYQTNEPTGSFGVEQSPPAWVTKAQGYNTFSNSCSWLTKAQGYNTFSNSCSWLTKTQGYNTFGNTASFTIVNQGWNTFGNQATYSNIVSGWNTFGNQSSWSDIEQGWNTFGHNASWVDIDHGWNTFGNTIAWTNRTQGWNTFGNASAWDDIEQGWNTFGNSSYMAILNTFPLDGETICPGCYEITDAWNLTYIPFAVDISHTNGTAMDITWSYNNSGVWTVFGHLTNQGNGSHYSVPSWNVTYGHIYQYKINVSDGVSSIEKVITFGTDTYSVCMITTLSPTQFSCIIMLILFIFLFWIGYVGEKRSAGAFMLISGLVLLGLIAVAFSYLPLGFVALLASVAGFITLLGVNKWLFKPNMSPQKPK